MFKRRKSGIFTGEKIWQIALFYSAAVSSAVAAVSAAVSSSLSSQATHIIAARIGKISFIISPHMKILKSGRLLTGLPSAYYIVSLVLPVATAASVATLLWWLEVSKESSELQPKRRVDREWDISLSTICSVDRLIARNV